MMPGVTGVLAWGSVVRQAQSRGEGDLAACERFAGDPPDTSGIVRSAVLRAVVIRN
jgi:hypothetical protein